MSEEVAMSVLRLCGTALMVAMSLFGLAAWFLLLRAMIREANKHGDPK